MTRYIDADALMRKAVEKFYITNYFTHISEMIDNAPTIDAVEVVRCKNCKYGSEDYPKNIFPDAVEETYSCEHSTYSHDKDFYCKYGKKE